MSVRGLMTPDRELLLSTADIEALGLRLQLSAVIIAQRLRAQEDGLNEFKLGELKSILMHLRIKYERTILLTGKKPALVKRIADTIYTPSSESSITTTSMTNSNDLFAPCPLSTLRDTININLEHGDLLSLCGTKEYNRARSPFYDLQYVIDSFAVGLGVADGCVYESRIVITPEARAQILSYERLRVHGRLYSHVTRCDISFVDGMRIRVNGAEIPCKKTTAKVKRRKKSKLFCTPPPVDLTETFASIASSLDKDFILELQCVYGCTETDMGGVFAVELVRELDLDELLDRWENMPLIESLPILTPSNDADITILRHATSNVNKCPLSLNEMRYPVRNRCCSHEKGFDLKAYLQLCRQTNQWHCPVCRLPSPFQDLGRVKLSEHDGTSKVIICLEDDE